MAEQQFYQRPNYERDDDQHQVYDDAPLHGSSQGQAASNEAQGTLDDIDSLLNEVSGKETNPTVNPSLALPTLAAPDLKNAENSFANPINFRHEGGSGKTSIVQRVGSLVQGKKRGIAIGSGIAGISIGGVISISTLLTGPLQTIHLAQLLMKNNDSSSSASENRLNKLFRYTRAGRTGDIGETRVGILGSKVFGNTIQQLKDVGIEFQRNPRTGNPKSMTIDTSKNPEFKGMSQDEARAAIAKRFGLPESTIQRIGSGSSVHGDKFGINTRDMGIKGTRALSKSSLTFLEDGKIVSGIRMRALADFFNAPSLFHPMDRAQASATNKLATVAERRAAERERAAKLARATNADAVTARARIKEQLNGVKGQLTKGLLITGIMCIVRAVADDVVQVNRAAIVVPAALQAVDKEAVGSQAEFSDGSFTSQQFDAVNESLVDKDGKSVFDARAVKVLDGNQTGGTDLGFDYSQAFSNNTTAANIKNDAGGGTFGGIVCSPIGQIVQLGAGIALAVSNVVDAGAGAAGLAALKEGAQFLAGVAVVSFIEHQLTNLLQDNALVPEVFSGPLGGNLMAYGAREAANTDVRAAGGIALSSSEELAYDQQANAESQKEFQAKPMFARMFDTHDYRSGISQVADSMNPNMLQNVSKLSSGFANITSLLPATLASLLPKAHAAETPYNWGFPKYGIPQSLLDATDTEDPYDNADKVAALLDTGNEQSYIDKAKTCFGVSINKDSGKWDVTPSDPINPNSDEYTSADCSNRNDKTWLRFILFIFDTRTMKAAACYQGDDNSCEYSGYNGAGATSADSATPTTAGSGSLPTGSARELATKLLPYISQGKISCAFQGTNCPDIQRTATGQTLKGTGSGSCDVDALNAQLLGIMLVVAQKGHSIIYSAICSDHTSPDPRHHIGKAADFNTIDGVFMGPDAYWTGDRLRVATKLDQDIAAVAPKGSVFGQVQCHPTFTFLQGFQQFNDACHHQHVGSP